MDDYVEEKLFLSLFQTFITDCGKKTEQLTDADGKPDMAAFQKWYAVRLFQFCKKYHAILLRATILSDIPKGVDIHA